MGATEAVLRFSFLKNQNRSGNNPDCELGPQFSVRPVLCQSPYGEQADFQFSGFGNPRGKRPDLRAFSLGYCRVFAARTFPLGARATRSPGRVDSVNSPPVSSSAALPLR